MSSHRFFFFIIHIIIICICRINPCIAAFAPDKLAFKDLFKVSSAPPKEFEAIAKPQIILIDVYYLGKFISVEKIKISPNKIQLIEPEHTLKNIDNLLQKDEVINYLKNELEPNMNMACSQFQKTGCGILSPEIAGLIYDPLLFRADLFINPRYITDVSDASSKWLPHSSSNWSYINHMFAAVDSGNNNPINNNPNPIENTELYNFTSDNTLAYHNMRLNVSASLSNQLWASVLGKNQDIQLNSANISYDYHDYEYMVGVIDTPGSVFFADYAFLGGSIKTTLNTLKEKNQYISKPIELFLPFPSTVSVLHGSKIIFSANLPAGRHKINTYNFPQGVYPVTIRTIGNQGETNISTQIVTNSTLLPPPNLPQYFLKAGYLMGIRQINSNVYDNLLPVPVYQAGINYLIRPNTAITLNTLGSNEESYFNPGLIFITKKFTIQPAILFSTGGKYYGVTTDFDWKNGPWGTHLNFNKVVQPDNITQEDICTLNNPHACALSLLNQGIYNANASLTYSFSSGSINIYGSRNLFLQSPELYSYGANFLVNLYQTEKGTWQFNFNINYGQSEYNALATILYNFSGTKLSGNVGAGYGFQTESIKNISNSGEGLNSQTSIIYDNTKNEIGSTYGFQGNVDSLNQGVGVTWNKTNQRFYSNTYVTEQKNSLGNFVQYGGQFDSNLVWAKNKGSIAYSRTGENTGILATIKSNDNNATFNVYGNNKILAQIRANTNYFIKLSPYKTWNIHIEDASTKIYYFEHADTAITLYPGNIQSMTWNAISLVVISGQIVNSSEQVIANAIVKGGIGFAMTDEYGYFQTTISQKVKALYIKEKEINCVINLPELQENKAFIHLNKIKCGLRVNNKNPGQNLNE